MKDYNNVTLVGKLNDETVMDDDNTCSFDLEVEDNIYAVYSHGKLAEICREYLRENTRVLVGGKLQKQDNDIVIIAEDITVLSYKK